MTNQNPSLIDRYNTGARDAFIEGVREHYAANANAFGDLPRIVDADFSVLSNVTLGELFPQDGATGASPPPAAPKPKKQRKKRAARKKAPPNKASTDSNDDGPDLRSEEGRKLYDDTVYGAIVKLVTASQDIDDNGSAWVKASEIRKELGSKSGKPAQLRGSFNRMIEAGKIQFTGKAAGTKYSTT